MITTRGVVMQSSPGQRDVVDIEFDDPIEHITRAFAATRKAGMVVVTQKRLQGSLFGASSPSRDARR